MTPTDLSAVVAGALFILGGLVLLVVRRRRSALSRASRSWPTVSGTVLASEVRRYGVTESAGRRYYPAVTYRYEVDGRTYSGKRMYFDEVGSTESWAAELARKYPVGSTVPVYYDPASPERALLEPRRSGSYNYGCIGCSFIALGIFFVVYLGYVMR